MNAIAIAGASGFIGRHLIAELMHMGHRQIKVLSRSHRRDLDNRVLGSGLEVIAGDLRDSDSLRELLDPGCTVVSLVYLSGAGETENLGACASLLMACRTAKIRRLIHISTASVVGRTSDDLITESTPCDPVTEYGITKLKIERAILEGAHGHFEAAILRPTAVFGAGGENLKKLARDLMNGNGLHNYLRSCLFGRRRMNLVHVTNVVASIVFLANYKEDIGRGVFNISDADSPLNNFADVERILMREFNIRAYGWPRITVPQGLLAFLLDLRGRDNINPRCDYSANKLLGLGFERPVSFETGLVEYAAWYRSSQAGGKRSGAA